MYGLDLFSGIGGLTKALEGYVIPIAFCEIDPYCRGVLLSRQSKGEIPYAPIWDDVATLQGADIPPVDIVYGGFPCQDISIAGRGAGLAGKRSGLFFEIVRLVSEIRPRFIFLENVPAIRTRGGDVVAGELARLGYDCRWAPLSAGDVGANHERERWWLLAHSRQELRGTGRNDEARKSPKRGGTTGEPKRPSTDVAYAPREQSRWLQFRRVKPYVGTGCEVMAHSKSAGRLSRGAKCCEQTQHAESFKRSLLPNAECDRLEKQRITRISQREANPASDTSWWAIEPNVGRVANGVPKRVDRLRALGNAVVPQQAREAFERLMGLK